MRNPVIEKLLKQQLADIRKLQRSRDPWKQLVPEYNRLLETTMNELLPYAAKMMGLGTRQLRKHIKSIAVTLKPAVNATATREPGAKAFDIRVYWGLMTYFHTMITVFLGRTGFGVIENGSKERVLEEPTVPFKKACSLAERAMIDFYGCGSGRARPEGTLLYELTDKQMVFWALFLEYAESFVIGHELGHLAIRLCPEKTDLHIALRITKDIISNLDLSHKQKESLLTEWGTEIGADLFGLGLLPNLGNNNVERVMAYSAAELSFIMFNMLEVFSVRKYRQSPPIGAHPPSRLRLEVMRLAVRDSNPPDIFQIGKAMEEQANNILSALFPG